MQIKTKDVKFYIKNNKTQSLEYWSKIPSTVVLTLLVSSIIILKIINIINYKPIQLIRFKTMEVKREMKINNTVYKQPQFFILISYI